MFNVTFPGRDAAVTKVEDKTAAGGVKEILLSNSDGFRAVMQEMLEAEMDETLGASKSERTSEYLGYRSGHYGRTLMPRVGKLELRVPQDRSGHFSTELFERYHRSERSAVLFYNVGVCATSPSSASQIETP